MPRLHAEERRCKESSEHWRLFEPLRRIDEDKNLYDVTRVFFEEFRLFPFTSHDDLIDAVSRIYDMDPQPPTVFEQIEVRITPMHDRLVTITASIEDHLILDCKVEGERVKSLLKEVDEIVATQDITRNEARDWVRRGRAQPDAHRPTFPYDELRAMTNSSEKRDSSVMMSPTIPSLKYSCSGSELRLVKGRTAMEG